MKTLKPVLVTSVLAAFLGAAAFANAEAVSGRKTSRVTVYDAKEKCQVICKAPKPILEILEDGLAYALDIPLAILSPITCPVVSAILDENDRGRDKRYPRSKK